MDKIQLNTEVEEIRYHQDEQIWEAKLIHLAQGIGDMTQQERMQLVDDKGRESVVVREETIRAKIICTAAGGLVEPNPMPNSIPGIETFEVSRFRMPNYRMRQY